MHLYRKKKIDQKRKNLELRMQTEMLIPHMAIPSTDKQNDGQLQETQHSSRTSGLRTSLVYLGCTYGYLTPQKLQPEKFLKHNSFKNSNSKPITC